MQRTRGIKSLILTLLFSLQKSVETKDTSITNKQFGKYKIKIELGRGAQGAVYLIEEKVDNDQFKKYL